MTNPNRGEIWLVDLDPTRGQEIWQDKFDRRPFMVKLPATKTNRLTRDSAANVLQIRSLSTQRFAKRLGQIEPEAMTEILAGLIICVDYEGNP